MDITCKKDISFTLLMIFDVFSPKIWWFSRALAGITFVSSICFMVSLIAQNFICSKFCFVIRSNGFFVEFIFCGEFFLLVGYIVTGMRCNSWGVLFLFFSFFKNFSNQLTELMSLSPRRVLLSSLKKSNGLPFNFFFDFRTNTELLVGPRFSGRPRVEAEFGHKIDKISGLIRAGYALCVFGAIKP